MGLSSPSGVGVMGVWPGVRSRHPESGGPTVGFRLSSLQQNFLVRERGTTTPSSHTSEESLRMS